MVNATLVAAAGDIAFSHTSTTYVAVVAGVAVFALILAGVFRAQVLKASEGTEKMQEIGLAVQEGASAYLNRQFRTLGFFAVLALAMLVALDFAVGEYDTKV
jgi:K(+)-stimulated pyrophosphate-energized sodium pump